METASETPAGLLERTLLNPTLEDLVMLAAVDGELTRHRAVLAEAPRRVAAAEARAKAAETTLAVVKTRLADEEKLRRRQESDAADHRGKLVRLRKNLDGATSAAQVTAFEHEIAFGERAIATLEDEELASMERTETLEVEHVSAVKVLETAQAGLAAERERAARVAVEEKAAILALETEQKATRSAVHAKDDLRLAQYDRLVKTRGSAIAEAAGNSVGGQCAACQMGVRPQRWQDLIGRDHLDEVFTCESCGRMLFWDPRHDSPQAWEGGARWRAATVNVGAKA